MFTENDFLHYFDQIQQIENKMRDIYQNLHDQLKDPEYKNIFGRMVNEGGGKDDRQVHGYDAHIG